MCVLLCTQEELLVGAPRVLVTGATGLLGRAVCREFHSAGWTVIGTGYRRARPRLLRCDLTDEDVVRGLLHEYKVLHAVLHTQKLCIITEYFDNSTPTPCGSLTFDLISDLTRASMSEST